MDVFVFHDLEEAVETIANENLDYRSSIPDLSQSSSLNVKLGDYRYCARQSISCSTALE